MSKNDEKPKVPGKGTFNFKDYIAGKSTFPLIKHTVYLNQAAGFELLRLQEEYTQLAERGKMLQGIQEQASSSGSMSLVDSAFEKQMEELQSIIERTDAIDEQMQELQKEYLESGMTIHFRAGAPQKLVKTLTKAEKEYKRLNGPEPEESDLEYIALKGAFVVAAQLADYTIAVYDAKEGEESDDNKWPVVPTRDEFLELMENLIPAESNALINKVREATDASVSWASQIDAGFPGRGADLGRLPLGGPRSENRPVLDLAPVDAVDGTED